MKAYYRYGAKLFPRLCSAKVAPEGQKAR